jgi:hypothetical protein
MIWGRWPLPPMWVRWMLAAIVAAVLIAALVSAVDTAHIREPTSELEAEAEANRIADLAITEDQAPHFAALPAGDVATSALEASIAADVRRRISAGKLLGPVRGVTCQSAGRARGAREPFTCTAHNASGGVQFVAVLDRADQRLAWCKIDPPSASGDGPEIPISRSCLP